MAYSSSLIRSAADAVGEFRRTSDRAAREHFPLKLLADRTAGHRRERMVRRAPSCAARTTGTTQRSEPR
jgi:hypothetical protein